MITHADVLKLYRVYIDNCIENTTDEDPVYPMSFTKWKKVVYDPMEENIMNLISENSLWRRE